MNSIPYVFLFFLVIIILFVLYELAKSLIKSKEYVIK